MQREKRHFFDKKEHIKGVLWAFYLLCAGLLIVDSFYHRHVTHEWERLWGFYAFYGFVACVILVLVAKGMRRFLMRSEEYYDDR